MTNRLRAERVAAAKTQIENATEQLRAALENMSATEIQNPIIEELREAILDGRRMIARAQDILKRIP